MGSGTKSRSKPDKKHKQGKGRSGSGKGRKKDRKLNARNADRYDLYQRAVNSPDTDVDFLLKAYAHHRGGRAPRHLREDFCGTAAMAAEWIARGPDFTAEGFDLDPEPMEWGKRNNFARLGDDAERMTWHVSDVRSPADRRPDVTAAQNFSYWCFQTREEMLEYFRGVHRDLADDGIFVIDLYGGPEAMTEMEEVRAIGGGIDYVWDQREYWPGTGQYHTSIHFRFKDGSEMTDAFRYVWRFWHLTELRDVLHDAGFVRVEAWFEGTDEEDEEEGDGNFEPDERGENCEAWIGYLTAAK